MRRISCALVLAFCLCAVTIVSVPVSAHQQSPAVQQQLRAEREAAAARRAKQRKFQRPMSEAECGVPNVPITVELDTFGNVETVGGTADAPLYVYGPSGLQLTPKAGASLQYRLVRPGSGGTPAENEKVVSSAVDFATIRAFERGGLVKLQIEEVRPGDAGSPPQFALVATLWLIADTPWTIVMDEKGPVDPRFKAAGPVFMPCPAAVFRYSKLDVPNAPTELVLQPTVARGEKPDPHVLRVSPEGLALSWEVDLSKVATDNEVHLAVEARGRAVSAVALTREPPLSLPTLTGRDAEDLDSVDRDATIFPINLDRTGIVTWQYLNRRRPPRLDFATDNAFLRFRNDSPDRQFTITIAGIPETERAALLLENIAVSCRDQKCQASVHVPSSSVAYVPLTPLRKAFVKGATGSVVTFQLAFFDDDSTPTFNRGYFSFLDAQFLAEPASATAWSAGASVVGQRDPDLTSLIPKGHKAPAIRFDSPWLGGKRSHVTGGATLGLKQTLGSRADAEFELSVKRGDFGGEASNVQATKYYGNVYAVYNATLTGGRFDIVAPTNGIALSESGEAVSLTVPMAGHWLGPLAGRALFGAARIFRKEITDGSFTPDAEQKVVSEGGAFLERNHTATLLQLREIRLPSRHLRMSLYHLDGRAKRGRSVVTDPNQTPPARELVEYDVDYRTWGADASWTERDVFIAGGVYRNKRRSNAAPAILLPSDDIGGTVGLLSVTYTEADARVVHGRRGVDWAVTGTVAGGGAYVGESQGFVPDSLFLNTFVPALKEPSVPLGPGLTNKWYVGATWMTPRWDLIRKLAEAIKFPTSEINTSTLTLKLHHYRQRGGDSGASHLATEGNIEFRLESPKGVRYTVTLAGLRPGPALTRQSDGTRLIDGFQFAARVGVSVRFD